MSEYAKIALGQEVFSHEVSPQFDTYSGVEIIVDEDTVIVWPTNDNQRNAGRVLRIENSAGTLAQAKAILVALQSNGFQYQPYTATGALLNPAAELGDGVTVNGIYSGIYKMSRSYSSLMSADIEAPYDEEIDHEYPYEPKQDRIYKREIAENKAQISITQTQIEAEVTRASAAEGNLSSRITATADAITSEVARAKGAESNLSSTITQTANEITASVVSRSGGSRSSFAWSLQSDHWALASNDNTVFYCDSTGVRVSGQITAKTGYIGDGSNGFRITATAIYNGRNSLNDGTHNGVYIGTDGISLGKGAFKVTDTGAVTASNLKITGGSISIGDNFRVSNTGAVTANNLKITGGEISIGSNFRVSNNGDVTANNMTLNGTLNVGGQYITADALRQGAQSAYNNGSYWSGGSGWGYSYGDATQYGASGATYFNANHIFAKGGLTVQGSGGASFWTNVTIGSGYNCYLEGWLRYRSHWVYEETITYVSDINMFGDPEYKTQKVLTWV